MLEEIVSAVQYARISKLLSELSHSDWEARTSPKTLFSYQQPVQREVAVLPSVHAQQDPTIISSDKWEDFSKRQEPDRVIVTYATSSEESVTYIIEKPTDHPLNLGLRGNYKTITTYAVPRTDIFYVHIPPWASIRNADSLEMGEHVLGTANITTGEIRLLHSLDPVQRTEVLLHETMHLLYPLHNERQIRDLVRTIMGKQYCCFH